MNNDAFLESKRLMGRKFRLEDAEDLFELYSDSEVVRYLGTEPPEDLEMQVTRLTNVIEKYKDSPYGAWAMRHKVTDELVAVILLKNLPDSENVEVGWHLPRKHWGNGYATEAGRAAISYGLKELGLNEVYAVVMPENIRSLRVAQRLGMESLGSTLEYYGKELALFRAAGRT